MARIMVHPILMWSGHAATHKTLNNTTERSRSDFLTGPWTLMETVQSAKDKSALLRIQWRQKKSLDLRLAKSTYVFLSLFLLLPCNSLPEIQPNHHHHHHHHHHRPIERRIGLAAGVDRGIVRGTISPSLQIMEREREKEGKGARVPDFLGKQNLIPFSEKNKLFNDAEILKNVVILNQQV